MSVMLPPTAGSGNGDVMVPRCRKRWVMNPEEEYANWKTKRCIRPDRHRGACQARTPDGATVRF